MNENKIIVKVCLGTYCFVSGGHDLKNLKNEMPDYIQNKIKVEASVCVGCDRLTTPPKPPYVDINGELMELATIEKIKEKLTQLLK